MPAAVAIAVTINTVLLQTDAPELVLSRDAVGATYLCSLIEVGDAGYHFFAVQVSDARIKSLRNGEIDLRSALVEPEIRVQYEGWTKWATPQEIQLEPVDRVLDDWLPETGLLLSAFSGEVSSEMVVGDAIAKNAAVIVYGINPPEARGLTPKVNADRLAEYISAFQDLVRRAAKESLVRMGKAAKDNAGLDPFALQVYGFSAGSFNIHFEAAGNADLFGGTIVGAAMQKIDRLVELSRLPPDDAVQAFKEHRGHVLSAYAHLLKLVTEREVPFGYRWAEPALTTPRGERISLDTARAAVAILSKDETLNRVPFSFSGRFTSVKTEPLPQAWTARDEKGIRKQGGVHEENPSALDGVTIRAQRYILTGEERLVSPRTGGSPTIKLFLQSAIPQDQ